MSLSKAVLALICHPTKPDLYLGVSRKNNPNDFGLVGGKMDHNKETVRDALAREVKEETGLSIKSMKPVFKRFNTDKNKKYLVRTYLVEVEDFNIHTEESGLVKWVTKEELSCGSFGNYNKNLFDSIENNLI